MKLLHTFNEENASEQEIASYKTRKAVRAIVIDSDNNLGILHITNHSYYELPGGGVEEGETLEEACIRECKEEVGCNVEIVSEIGRTLEYRKEKERINESFCYVVKVVGEKGTPELQDDEIEIGTETVWVSKEEGVRLIKESLEKLRSTISLYDKYVIERSVVFLNEFK